MQLDRLSFRRVLAVREGSPELVHTATTQALDLGEELATTNQ
jgi:hypothetical protein